MEDEVLRATGGTWTGPGHDHEGDLLAALQHGRRGLRHGPGRDRRDVPAHRRATSDARIRVVETASNEGGTAQAVSPVTAVVDELHADGAPADGRPSPRSMLPHRLVLNEVVTNQTGDTVTLEVKVSDDRGFRVGGVQVRVTPTGLLAGPRCAKTERRPTAGRRSPSARPAPAPPTCSSRPAGRARSHRQRDLDLEPVQGPRPLGPFSARRVLPKHVCRTCEMRAFLPSGRKGADQSQRSPLFMLSRASSLRPGRTDPPRCSSRTPAPRRRRVDTAASVSGSAVVGAAADGAQRHLALRQTDAPASPSADELPVAAVQRRRYDVRRHRRRHRPLLHRPVR